MALTWTEIADSRQNVGPSMIVQANTAAFGSSDYVLGGYVVNPASFGLRRLYGLEFIAYAGGPSNYWWTYNSGVGTLQAFNGSSQASASTDFSGLTMTILAYGF